MFASYVPRNAFSAWHDPSYDVIGQMLGGQGLEIFRGGCNKDGRKAMEKWWYSNGKQKDIPEKPQGAASPPPPPCAGEG